MRCSLKFDRAGVTAFEDCSNYTWKPFFFFPLFLFLQFVFGFKASTAAADDNH